MEQSDDNLITMLPGGYVDRAGAIHREVELAPLSGREEELIAAAPGRDLPALVTAVISRCARRIGAVSPVTATIARELLVTDRLFLLLKLRELTLGRELRAQVACPWPDCDRLITVRFSVDDVPVVVAEGRAPRYTLALSPEAAAASRLGDGERQVVFRLPDGADQELLTPLVDADEIAAEVRLLARCVEQIGPHRPPAEAVIARLPPAARSEITRRMAAVAPQVDLTIESACPECGRAYRLPFDLPRFFFAELRAGRGALYREVHYLAYHYHWGEREIMGMSRRRRRAYIEVLAAEIERMNDGR